MENKEFIKREENLPPLPNRRNELLNAFYPQIKRLNDIFFSLFLLILTLPIFIILAIWIKIDSPGPIIYKQKRGGKEGKPFYMYKLRTMYQGADKKGLETEENDPRITKIGKVIRSFRLDEMPQMINILKGEMSFVGPRAQPYEYSKDWLREGVLGVQPGIFCWYQLNYKDIFIPEKVFECEREYIEHFSWETDAHIVFTTLSKYKQLFYWILPPFSICLLLVIVAVIYYVI